MQSLICFSNDIYEIRNLYFINIIIILLTSYMNSVPTLYNIINIKITNFGKKMTKEKTFLSNNKSIFEENIFTDFLLRSAF